MRGGPGYGVWSSWLGSVGTGQQSTELGRTAYLDPKERTSVLSALPDVDWW